METIENHERGYTHAELARLESTLLWAEKNLREPQINCLEGRGVRSELLDSPRNIQWMRLWTTLSLTHSDGYVLFTMGSHLDHPHTPLNFGQVMQIYTHGASAMFTQSSTIGIISLRHHLVVRSAVMKPKVNATSTALARPLTVYLSVSSPTGGRCITALARHRR